MDSGGEGGFGLQTLSISMMAFGFAVLLAAMVIMPLQALLAYLLVRENRKLVNGRSTDARLSAHDAALSAAKLQIAALEDLVATFGNRAAVRSTRRKRKEEETEPDDGIPEEHRHLFEEGVVSAV